MIEHRPSKPLIFRAVFDDINISSSISIIGWEQCEKSKPIIESNKSCYILHFVTSGKGFIIKNGIKHRIEKNTCFLLTPNSHDIYGPDTKDPWSYFWLELSGNQIKRLLSFIDFEKENMAFSIENHEEVIAILNTMIDENASLINKHAEILRLESLLYRLFSIIALEHDINPDGQVASKTEQEVKQVLEYINNNYSSFDFTVTKIAKAFYFNVSYLSRIFKQHVGISPAKYIISLRMRKAAELIKTKNYSISQISYALGYKNQFYFSKEFKRFYDTTPSNYAKNY